MKILSIILGFVMGWLIISQFRSIQYHGPNSNQIKKNVYFDPQNNYCYRMIPQTSICPLGTLTK